MNRPCTGASWCALLATPNTDVCVWHLKYPLINNFETYAMWIKRVKKTEKRRAGDAVKQRASDTKLANR